MLKIVVPLEESFDEDAMRIIVTKGFELELEHSLVSLSKWESKYEKSFLSTTERTAEETFAYIQAMALTPDVPPEIWSKLTPANVNAINEYVNAKMTATTFRDIPGQKKNNQIVTAEIIYHMMVALNIPMDAENWHLSRLITLIRVIDAKNQPTKKMNPKDAIAERNRINEERRRKYNSNG